MVIIHSFHMLKPSQYSDLLYSLTPFLFQISYAPLHTQLYPFATLQPNFSNTSSQEHSLSFSQHFLYPMRLLRATPLVQLLLHIDTFWPLSPILIAQDTFQCSPISGPHIYSVYHNINEHNIVIFYKNVKIAIKFNYKKIK